MVKGHSQEQREQTLSHAMQQAVGAATIRRCQDNLKQWTAAGSGPGKPLRLSDVRSCLAQLAVEGHGALVESQRSALVHFTVRAWVSWFAADMKQLKDDTILAEIVKGATAAAKRKRRGRAALDAGQMDDLKRFIFARFPKKS
jgi:hypothetical protein